MTVNNIYTLTLNWNGDVEDKKLGLAPVQAYIDADQADDAAKAKAKADKTEAPKGLMSRLTPVLHKDPKFQPISIQYKDGEDKTQLVQDTFKKLVTDGKNYNFSFGKQLTVVDDVANKTMQIVSIDDKQFTLPAYTADFVPVIKGTKDGKEVYYFVGIIRANPPGKGKLATAGGFCNVKKPKGSDVEVFSSLIHTALSEGKQEIRSKIETEIPLDQLKTDYDTKSLKGTIEFEGKKLPCQIVHTSTMPSSNKMISEGGEQIAGTNGHKRVFVCASIGIYTEVPSEINLTPEVVLRNFTAHSDASGLTVLDVTDAINNSKDSTTALAAAKGIHEENLMGIDHHREILQNGFLGANRYFVQKADPDMIGLSERAFTNLTAKFAAEKKTAADIIADKNKLFAAEVKKNLEKDRALEAKEKQIADITRMYEEARVELDSLKAAKKEIKATDETDKKSTKWTWKQIFSSPLAWIRSFFKWS